MVGSSRVMTRIPSLVSRQAARRWSSLPVALLLGCVLTALPSQIQAQSAETGQQLYATMLGCAGCHGAEGEGGVGPAIRKTKLQKEEFVQFIRTPEGAMPPFNARLASDEDLEAIYKWLQRTTEATSPPAVPDPITPALLLPRTRTAGAGSP